MLKLKQRNEEEMDESLMPLGFNDYDLEPESFNAPEIKTWFNY
jgi:hypothetical protein